MMLQRWDPLRELRRVEDAADRLWRGFSPHAGKLTSNFDVWSIPLDVVHEGDEVIVQASLPGVNPADINVSIEDRLLTVEGVTEPEARTSERKYLVRERRGGSFRRTLRLPDGVDTEQATSFHDSGVLTITLPMTELAKSKRLTVEVKDAKELGGTGSRSN